MYGVHSRVLLIPAALRDRANVLGEVRARGPDSFTIPLSDGQSITYYGLHSWARSAFSKIYPDDLDFPREEFDEIMAAVIVSEREDATDHFAEVIAANGLSLVEG